MQGLYTNLVGFLSSIEFDNHTQKHKHDCSGQTTRVEKKAQKSIICSLFALGWV